MSRFVAATGQAGEFARFDRGEGLRIYIMSCPFFKRSGPLVTVQAFSVVVWSVELHPFRHITQVLDVDMFEPSQFCFHITIHSVICMAGKTGFIPWNHAVLEMDCRDKRPVLYSQTLAIVVHHVTRETELCS